MKSILKITLLAIIPLAILGFNLFEKTGIYKKLFKFTGVESALQEKLTTNFGSPKRLIIVRNDDPQEFDHLWNIIKSNCHKDLPSWTPKIISRVAIENGSSVTLPDIGKIILVPREVPVIALNASYQDVTEGKATKEHMFMIGTVGDIDKWFNESKANVRFIFDLILSVCSITLGIILEFVLTKTPKPT